jgi:hypothetical protein
MTVTAEFIVRFRVTQFWKKILRASSNNDFILFNVKQEHFNTSMMNSDLTSQKIQNEDRVADGVRELMVVSCENHMKHINTLPNNI